MEDSPKPIAVVSLKAEGGGFLVVVIAKSFYFGILVPAAEKSQATPFYNTLPLNDNISSRISG